jgi:hypothetical protein
VEPDGLRTGVVGEGGREKKKVELPGGRSEEKRSRSLSWVGHAFILLIKIDIKCAYCNNLVVNVL